VSVICGDESTYLASESIQKPDRVDLEDRVNRSTDTLQILCNVFREELNDVDQGIHGCNTLLESASLEFKSDWRNHYLLELSYHEQLRR